MKRGPTAPARAHRPRHTGMALLSAMILVTVVATLCAGALMRQSRDIEVERAQRAHQQVAWLLRGALDWARLILNEDGRTSTVDDLQEPWATPLKDSRLSTFLAADGQSTDGLLQSVFSGYIEDEQSRLNVGNLVQQGSIVPASRDEFQRLFAVLGLPGDELDQLLVQLRLSLATQPSGSALLPPGELEQLLAAGLSESTLARLRPFITLLPERTPVNLNTAPPEVLVATLKGLGLADARRMVASRAVTPWNSIADAARMLGQLGTAVNAVQHATGTRYFRVHVQLRYDDFLLQEQALVRRDGAASSVLAMSRDVMPIAPAVDAAGLQTTATRG